MGIVRGLKQINDFNDEAAARKEAANRPSTEWFKVEPNKTVEVAFLQELDPDSPRYSAKNDLGFLAVEHVNPDNFRRKAVCTMDDEGNCFGCEKHKEDWKAGWKQKTRLYINVLVKEEGKDPYVAVMSQSTSGQSITPTLIEYAGDDGTITEKWFAIKRTGEKTETSYSLRQKKEHGLDVESYELFDLENVVRQVPYAQQEAHYLDNAGTEAAAEGASSAAAEAGSSSNSVVW